MPVILRMGGGKPASGTAVAADVLDGKTFSNSSGTGLAGSMPNRAGANYSDFDDVYPEDGYLNVALLPGYYPGGYENNLRVMAAMPDNSSPNQLVATNQYLYVRPEPGYYDGTKYIRLFSDGFSEDNILPGIDIFGMEGNAPVRKFQTGYAIADNTMSFYLTTLTTEVSYFIEGTLSFKPSVFVVLGQSSTFEMISVYDNTTDLFFGTGDYYEKIKVSGYNGGSLVEQNKNFLVNYPNTSGPAILTNYAFRIPVYRNSLSVSYQWFAIE